jgi:glutamate---cysteine ligase / carboxylate-amine ligase
LHVLPASDLLLCTATGEAQSDIERGSFCWSNELVLHLIEIKTNGPAGSLRGLAGGFQEEVREINRRLQPLGARLMPTGMHPWMNPHQETRIWPHEYSPVYQAYNRIFGCQGHGWSNLQSMHLNLPFADDREFGALHAAIRALLPLLPALAASSPIVDGRFAGWLDHRLAVYRANSEKIPSLTGHVIPEAAFTELDYQHLILERMYRDIAPHDPEGLLQDEFLNSRGAIARFERGSIEIRVLDSQECPAADLAIAGLLTECLRSLVQERWVGLARLKALSTAELRDQFLATAEQGEQAVLEGASWLEVFGLSRRGRITALEIWEYLVAEHQDRLDESAQRPLEILMREGPLARRILKALGGDCRPERLRQVYGALCDCLESGDLFLPANCGAK